MKKDYACEYCNGTGKTNNLKRFISIAEDFSKTPGGRTIDSGDFSAELLLKNILIPQMEEAKKYNATVVIDLDGTIGYAASFIDEVFSNPIFSSKDNKIPVEIISKEEPSLIKEIVDIWMENSFI